MNKITKKEIKELAKVLEIFETKTLNETGVHRISGGFAIAEMDNYDNDYIYIQLRWGIQSDCEDRVNTENWLLDRSVLNSKEISVVEKAKLIRD